jgi:multidrug efflux pump subunit AcrA (membrane-fusion protein)
LQSILAKAEIPRTAELLRNQQVVKARITWNTAPALTIPVLTVSLVGGQSFVFLATPQGSGFVAHQVPVTLGETVGNFYPVLSGLKPGDKVITSGLQFLQEGASVMPVGKS